MAQQASVTSEYSKAFALFINLSAYVVGQRRVKGLVGPP
jgi:hypothetical protein